jgi:hypothetical protein
MSAIKLNSSGGGSITISPASTASTLTLTAPAQTATIGIQGPAFYATKNGAQSVSSNTQTKITVPNEQFDTASCYDTSTSRFTPNVAGYYQINYAVYGGGTVNTQAVISALYKNGAIYGTISTSGTYVYAPSAYSDGSSAGSALVYMNGSTDYLELYGLLIGSGTLNISQARFDGCLVRGA